MLILTLVSERGATLDQRRYPISIAPASHYSPKTVALNSTGNLVVAISGTRPMSSLDRTKWINSLTGTTKYCTTPPEATLLLSIDLRTLDLRDQRIIQNEQVIAIRQSDGHLYAVFGYHINCKLNRYVRLVELKSEFQLITIFDSHNVNSIDVTDLVITKKYFVLVGDIRIFLPTTVVQKPMTIEQLKEYAPDLWRKSFWEEGEEHASAFVLVVSSDGVKLGDRVFADVLNRRISNVMEEPSGKFVAVGDALGDRGWAVGFSLTDRLIDTVRAVSTHPNLPANH